MHDDDAVAGAYEALKSIGRIIAVAVVSLIVTSIVTTFGWLTLGCIIAVSFLALLFVIPVAIEAINSSPRTVEAPTIAPSVDYDRYDAQPLTSSAQPLPSHSGAELHLSTQRCIPADAARVIDAMRVLAVDSGHPYVTSVALAQKLAMSSKMLAAAMRGVDVYPHNSLKPYGGPHQRGYILDDVAHLNAK